MMPICTHYNSFNACISLFVLNSVGGKRFCLSHVYHDDVCFTAGDTYSVLCGVEAQVMSTITFPINEYFLKAGVFRTC
jgi:hypothetical protein